MKAHGKQMIWVLIVIQLLSTCFLSVGGVIVCVEADGRVSVERLQDGCCVSEIGKAIFAPTSIAERDSDCGDCRDQLLDSHGRAASRYEAAQVEFPFLAQVEFHSSLCNYQFLIVQPDEVHVISPPDFSGFAENPIPTRC